MVINVGKNYRTVSGHKATITYKQPSEVIDEFPCVGHVEVDGKKVGFCWSRDGFSGEETYFDIAGDWDEKSQN